MVETHQCGPGFIPRLRAYLSRPGRTAGWLIAPLALALVPLYACSASVPQTGATDSEITVFAASSTRVINQELLDAAHQSYPHLRLAFNNAGSTTLVHQIGEKAPADLLITASKQSMDQAVANGSVSNPVELAKNHMVMVVAKDNPGNIHSLEDLKEHHVLVMCDVAVPCGQSSAKISQALGLALHPDSLETQVADVLGKVISGEADAGWVYSTDAVSAGDLVQTIEIPGALRFPNSIYAAVVSGTKHPELAGALLDLLAHDFTYQWQSYGFIPVA